MAYRTKRYRKSISFCKAEGILVWRLGGVMCRYCKEFRFFGIYHDIMFPNWELFRIFESQMRIISVKKLREFWEKNADSRDALESWNAFMSKAEFKNSNDLREVFNHVDFIGDGITIFNIKGNDFRLIVHMMYKWQVIFILWIGTHKAYDKLTESEIKKLKEPK